LGAVAGTDVGLALALVGFAAALLGGTFVSIPLASRLVIDADGIEYRHFGHKGRLRFADIAGRIRMVTYGARFLILVPRNPELPKLRIQNIFRFDHEFNSWVASLPDIDASERQESLASILADKRFGSDADARRENLTSARETAFALNSAAAVILLWGYLYPHPYALVVVLAISLPVIGVVLVGTSKGVFRFEGSPNDQRPHVMFLPIVPAFVLPRLGFLDIGLVSYAESWAMLLCWTGVSAALLFALFRFAEAKFGVMAKTENAVTLAVVYAFGIVLIANTSLDVWPEQTFDVVIVDKHYSTGGYNSSSAHYLKVSPWGPRRSAEDIFVSYPTYSSAAVGDARCVHTHQGALRMRWFQLQECQGAASPSIPSLRS